MLPVPTFLSPAEPYAPYEAPVGCDPTAKPGVVAFRDFVLQQLGGGPGSIERACVGAPSEHHLGKAWDWSMRLDRPDEARRVATLIDWLTAADAELFRRAGLLYLIWNKKIFSSSQPGWRDYDGYSAGVCVEETCLHPHTDHVHFSFSTAGANGQTSFYDWLMLGAPSKPIPPGLRAPTGPELAALLGFGVGFTLTVMWRRGRLPRLRDVRRTWTKIG